MFKNKILIRNWTKEQWVVFLSYTAYYYIINEYEECGDYDTGDFMDCGGKCWLFDDDILDELENIGNEYLMDLDEYRGGILLEKPVLTFVDFYNIIDKYSLEKLTMSEDFQNIEFTIMDIYDYIHI